jgi:excisionase family DNA binding protein
MKTGPSAYDCFSGLFDNLPPSEQNRFISERTGATAPQPPPKLLTVEEVAARFECTTRTVRNWITTGELPAIKRGRLIRIPETALYAPRGGKGINERSDV